jgi:predicted DNA-binding transcriptional regulator
MADPTLRDRVWMFVVAKAVKGENAVRPGEVAASTGASERMVRQCLLSILQSGLVERRTDPNGEVQYVPSSQVEWTPEH